MTAANSTNPVVIFFRCGSISNVMKLFKASGHFGWCNAPIYNEVLQIATPKQDKFLVWFSKIILSFRPGRAQNGSTDEKHGFSQCYHRLKKVTGSVAKQKNYAILNDRLEAFDRYWYFIFVESINIIIYIFYPR
jgi:hypothetical protein